MDTTDLLRALQEIDKRAERTPDEYVVSTYVNEPSLVGALFASDNGVVFGRRGTGKTHALTYLAETKRQEGDFVVYIDMEQDIGSTEGRYVDQTLSLEERATRLVVDVLNIVHERLLEDAFEGNTAIEIDILDRMIDHFKEVVVVKEVADTAGSSLSQMSSGSGAIKLSPKTVGVELGTQDKSDSMQSHSRTATGAIRHRIHFGGVSGPMRQVVREHKASRCWILLDE